jgi:hypothetical protein
VIWWPSATARAVEDAKIPSIGRKYNFKNSQIRDFDVANM